jgi:UDP-N-acetylmuramyl pentapeptide phosphotransferase/UDP-N-acetylglucosamine-1-phosphate transferase
MILAVTHGFNLADGIDGLAGSLAVTALGLLGGWFFVVGENTFALVCFTLLGGVLAFLKFNWFPAKIFMGDTGSLTLGFTLAILLLLFFKVNEALPFYDPSKITASFSMGIMLVGYPVLDTSRVLIRRILRKKNPFKADSTHIHHVLLESKLNHGDATKLIGFSHLFLVLVTYEFSSAEDSLLIPIIVVFFVFVATGIEAYLGRLKALKLKGKSKVQLES